MSQKQRFFREFEECMSGIVDKRGFFTAEDLKVLWTEGRLTRFLDLDIINFSKSSKKGSEWKRKFIEDRLKIISVLIYIEWENWDEFDGIFTREILNGKYRQRDKQMPLHHEDLWFLIPKCQSGFMEAQRLFLPFRIKQQLETQRMTGQDILPFTKEDDQVIGHGMGGEVHHRVIPPGYYQEFDGKLSTARKVVATKSIENREWRQEIENLQIFAQSLNKHHCIMKYLAIIREEISQKEEIYHIIMEQGSSNLNKFLHSPEIADEHGGINIWDLLGDAAELAGALAWLHEYIQIEGEEVKCCHMDLKPDNVLVFMDADRARAGRWKIADFGISVIRNPTKIHEEDQRTPTDFVATILTKTTNFSGTYVAPELVDRPKKGGRASDIWSYGCILVEVVASRLTGTGSLKCLDESRLKDDEGKGNHHSDSYYRDGALNPNVERWVDALNKTALCLDRDVYGTVALSEYKSLLKDMLCIATSNVRRPLARNVRRSLLSIKDRCPMKEDLGVFMFGATPSEPIDLSMFEDAYQRRTIDLLISRGETFQADVDFIFEIKQWIIDPHSRLLWISEQWSDEAKYASLVCSGIMFSAQSHEEKDIPRLIYSCYDYVVSPDDCPVSPINLIYSLIYQIQTKLNVSQHRLTMQQHRFDEIQKPHPTNDIFKLGICLLRELWQLPSHDFLCVIDGFHILEESKDPRVKEQIRELVSVLGTSKSGVKLPSSWGNKTVISTVGRSDVLGTVGKRLDYSDFTSGMESSLTDSLVSSFGML